MRPFLYTLATLAILPTAAIAEVLNIDNAQLARLSASGTPVIDIRTENEWRSTGIFPGSRLLTFFDARGNANPPQWLQQVRSFSRPDQPVILICRSGNRSTAAARYLSEQGGYATVYNVSQGLAGWAAAGNPLTPMASSAATGPTTRR